MTCTNEQCANMSVAINNLRRVVGWDAQKWPVARECDCDPCTCTEEDPCPCCLGAPE